jgi:galactokinase
MKDCIINNNVIDAGKILIESHDSLKQDYEVSCKEIDYLIDISIEYPDWYGGRIMGGGFGGCTINLVRNGSVDKYIDLISRNYRKKFGLELEFYLV